MAEPRTWQQARQMVDDLVAEGYDRTDMDVALLENGQAAVATRDQRTGAAMESWCLRHGRLSMDFPEEGAVVRVTFR